MFKIKLNVKTINPLSQHVYAKIHCSFEKDFSNQMRKVMCSGRMFSGEIFSQKLCLVNAQIFLSVYKLKRPHCAYADRNFLLFYSSLFPQTSVRLHNISTSFGTVTYIFWMPLHPTYWTSLNCQFERRYASSNISYWDKNKHTVAICFYVC